VNISECGDQRTRAIPRPTPCFFEEKKRCFPESKMSKVAGTYEANLPSQNGLVPELTTIFHDFFLNPRILRLSRVHFKPGENL
jgi:hypothetical protein